MLARRLLLLWLLMFWQGGFMFYGGVVVTVGTDVLGSATDQGQITQPVTNWLNLAGVVALAAWAWDIAAEPAPARSRRLRWSLWLIMLLLLGALAMLHSRMDELLLTGAGGLTITDHSAFRQLHRWYLQISTVQWLGCIALSWATLRTWREADQRMGIANG